MAGVFEVLALRGAVPSAMRKMMPSPLLIRASR